MISPFLTLPPPPRKFRGEKGRFGLDPSSRRFLRPGNTERNNGCVRGTKEGEGAWQAGPVSPLSATLRPVELVWTRACIVRAADIKRSRICGDESTGKWCLLGSTVRNLRIVAPNALIVSTPRRVPNTARLVDSREICYAFDRWKSCISFFFFYFYDDFRKRLRSLNWTWVEIHRVRFLYIGFKKG